MCQSSRAERRGSMSRRATLFALAAVSVLAGCGAPVEYAVTGGGVVSCAPNVTETVFALGEGARLVAVSSFCDYPPEARGLPTVGGILDPDLERITRLAPERIIVQGNNEKVIDLAARRGIPLTAVNMDSIATILDGVNVIGAALGRPDRAEALVAAIRTDLDAVRAAVDGRPRPRVLILTGRQLRDMSNLHTVGGPSFLSELVEAAGGDNIYADARQAYLEASKETVAVRAPEVVLEFHAGEDLSDEDARQYVADWSRLRSLPAVRDGRVHVITESHAMRPGPRVAQVARLLASLLHPEAALPALSDTDRETAR